MSDGYTENTFGGWSRLVCIAAVVGTACAGLGCSSDPDVPHARASWTGRLVHVTVRDAKNREYQAMGLRLESGPRALRSSYMPDTVERVPLGEVALLNRTGKLIVRPDEVAAPVGARVRVDGLMMYTGMGVVAEEPDGLKYYKPVVDREPYDTGGSLMLQMRGGPKVLSVPEAP